MVMGRTRALTRPRRHPWGFLLGPMAGALFRPMVWKLGDATLLSHRAVVLIDFGILFVTIQ